MPPDVQFPGLLEWLDDVADRFERECAAGRPPAVDEAVDAALGDVRALLQDELNAIADERRQMLPQAGEGESQIPSIIDASQAAILDVARFPPSTGDGGPLSSNTRRSKPRFPTLEGFQILEEIGRGAHGVVYRARSFCPERIVAVKMLSAGVLAGSSVRSRFEKEATALAGLNQPNIVQIFGSGVSNSLPYIVCEYVPGSTLREYVDRQPVAPRDAAQLVAVIADGVQHAHERGVVHRDLKPANILLTGSRTAFAGAKTAIAGVPRRIVGVPKIVDFGLAKIFSETADVNGTHTEQLLGSPAYMAPEQAKNAKEAGPAADVYSLGVILYELLTGRPPFQGDEYLQLLKRVELDEPVPPSRLQAGLPSDLDTIVLKCLEKPPQRRYTTAAELASDLRRYLAGEPIYARPLRWWGRVWRWTGRHKRARAGVLIGLALCAGLLGVATVVARERGSRMLKLQRLQQDPFPSDGWYQQSQEAIRELRNLQSSDNLQALAVAALAGVDAVPARELAQPGASSLAFDANGERLLIGGSLGDQNDPPQPARIWNVRTAAAGTFSRLASPGPVTFASDDEALQLAPALDDHLQLILWDLSKDTERARFRILDEPAAEPLDELNTPALALSDKGSYVAASTTKGRDAATLALWDAKSGKLRTRIPQHATAICFSPDEKWMAAGNEDGEVSVWSLPDAELVAKNLSFSSAQITALKFGRDAAQNRGAGERSGWVLAAAIDGGDIVVWDIERQQHRSLCRGSQYGVYSLAFCPDGATLASVGRYGARLWDVATGRGLLWLHEQNGPDYSFAVEFSPDGKQLATAANFQPIAGPIRFRPGRVILWNLDWGRGIQSLRGLSSNIENVQFARDESLVCAIAHNWEIGVWEIKSGRLRHVFRADSGSFVDNTAMVFNDDATRLVYSAGRNTEGRVVLWDLKSGMELQRWQVPPGLNNQAGFTRDGRLLHFQVETEDGRFLPVSGVNWTAYPRIGRIRDLSGEVPVVVAEIPDFPRFVRNAYMDSQARWILIQGLATDDKNDVRTAVYDAATGKRLWTAPPAQLGSLRPDSAFRTFLVGLQGSDPRPQLYDIATFQPLDWRLETGALGPQAQIWFAASHSPETELTLYHHEHAAPIVTLGTGTHIQRAMIGYSGRYVAYLCKTPTIMLCDLERIRDELRPIGLGW
jgi:WD40 repeat protein/tRNA A-37 threonylcarbamoyl transferase component Bud32